MTPDKTPTDDELKAMLPTKQLARDEAPKVQVWLTQSDALVFARAVLAKQGSPVVAGEPVAWRHRMGPTDCWVDCSKEFHDWVLREPEAWKGDEVQALCIATPQPTQAQAGAVDDDRERLFWEACQPHGKVGEVVYMTYKTKRDAAIAAKGGSDGVA